MAAREGNAPIEVFIAFSDQSLYPLLEETCVRWADCTWAEPIMVQVNEGKFEIQRRVVADKMAKEKFYILADLGCVSEDERIIPKIQSRITDWDGMVGFSPSTNIPTGVRVCQKGVITKWPMLISPTYDHEHSEAVKGVHKRVTVWPDISYRHLREC